jgi:hypothetical protein
MNTANTASTLSLSTARAKKLRPVLASALALIESDSIRRWATSDHNLPIVMEIAKGFKSPDALCAYLVATAIGL